ncbi:MAG: hypothetical protein ABI833_08415 [Acidobacteriota bacterium]
MPLSVITGIACMVGGISLLATWRALRSRLTPERREQRRRLDLNVNGRLGDALLTECDEDTLYYTYEVRGVHYTASQDISSLREQLPGTPDQLGGMVNLKYAAQNPANSILICEDWSGLRVAPRNAGASSPAANGAPSTNSAPLTNSAALANSNGIGHQAQDPTLAQGS